MISLRQSRREARRALAQALRNRFVRGAKDERGAVALIFALAIVVLVPLVLGFLDVYTWHEQRSRLQDSLDAATLFAARSDKNTNAEIDALGDKALLANLKLYRGAVLQASDFSLSDNNTRIVASATVQPQALAPAFWSHPPITVSTNVIRASTNLEVALVLDVTNSMNTNDKIGDLREAAQELVGIVVKDVQSPFYSKVAVVPWSSGVNLGSYADQVRGVPTGTRTITNIADWHAGSRKTVSAVSRANKALVTTQNNHGFSTGDTVMVTSITGNNNMTQLNGRYSTITKINDTQFRLDNVDSSSFNNYSGSNGRATKCARTDCAMVVTTASAHGYQNGDYVFIDGVSPSGLDSVLDDNTYQVSNVTANTFNVLVAAGPTTAYSSGGTAYCTAYGCEFHRFKNASSSSVRLFKASTCVSERTGAQALTDAAPSTSWVGFNYPAANTNGTSYENTAVNDASSSNECLGDKVMPLSSDKAAIKGLIAGLQAKGSTAGQIGTAWGWYMVSPNFGYLWPGSQPAPYSDTDTIKAVVLMTDGALNSPYCQGVIAADALSGSGSSSDHINCNATNGSVFTQSLALCEAMQQAKIIVYTVGFDINADTTAQNFVTTCASDPSKFYMPDNGTELKEAFRAIGADINNLRLAK